MRTAPSTESIPAATAIFGRGTDDHGLPMALASGSSDDGSSTMIRPDWKTPLAEAFEQAVAYLEALPERPLAPMPSTADLRAALGGPLPDGPSDPREVVARLARAAGPGIMPSGSGRYFGFVVGGTTPAALAADWLPPARGPQAGLGGVGAAGGGRRGGRGRVGRRRPRPARRLVRRVRHRCAVRERHRPRDRAGRGAARRGVELGRAGPVGRSASAGAGRRGPARDDRPGAALPGGRRGRARAGPGGRPGPAAPRGAARGAGPRRGPARGLCPARQRQLRCPRPRRRDLRPGARARWLGARRRR